MSKHTPGPWHVVPENEYHATYIEPNIATISRRPSPQVEADARLITHAPDLLEILREVLEWADPYPEGFLQGDNYVESYQRALALVDSL